MHRFAPLLLVSAAAIGLLGLTACSSNDTPQDPGAQTGAFGRPTVTARGHVIATSPEEAGEPGQPGAAPAGPTGPAIEVTWEALAREKYLLENSRFRRRNQPVAPQKITLFSESHPDAKRVSRARSKGDRDALAHSAVLPDRDMLAFVRGLETQGFFRLARPSGYDSALVSSPNARGRVIVNRNGRSVTLLSMRGQGQNPQTRQIPKVYSETKQAIMVLRNMTPTLNVTHFSRSGKARTR